MSYKRSSKVFVDMPAVALEEMEQKIVCPFCGFKYEVIGSGFFAINVVRIQQQKFLIIQLRKLEVI